MAFALVLLCGLDGCFGLFVVLGLRGIRAFVVILCRLLCLVSSAFRWLGRVFCWWSFPWWIIADYCGMVCRLRGMVAWLLLVS